MAPTSKKSNTPSASSSSKSGLVGKKSLPSVASSGKSGKSEAQKSSYGSGKGLPGSSYSSGHTPGKQKSSATFGVIWLPSRRNKNKKEKVYDSYKDDYKEKKYPHNYFMAEERENLSKGSEGHHEKAESTLPLVGAGSKLPAVGSVAAAGVITSTPEDSNSDRPDDKSEAETFISHHGDDNNDHKDEYEKKRDCGDDDSMDSKNNRSGEKSGNKGDNMDGVYVKKSTSSGKTRSSSEAENGNNGDDCDKCIIDCLYYSMQCCQCSIS